MRIPVSDKTESANGAAASIEPSGDAAGQAYISGGERTSQQNADEVLEEHNATRQDDEEMQGRQQSGEVETQTTHHHPAAGHPQEGMPPGQPEGREGEPPSEDEKPAVSNQAYPASPPPEEDFEDKYRRLAAEFHNYKQQVMRREAEVRDRAIKGLVHDLLPVMDNFERALQATQGGQDTEALRTGVEYILLQLQEALRSHGIEPIQAQGRLFDPLHHDALEQVPNSEQPEGTVLDEATRGYSFKGQVLRPSRVRVAGPS